MKYASSGTTNIYSLQYLLVVCKWSTRVRRHHLPWTDYSPTTHRKWSTRVRGHPHGLKVIDLVFFFIVFMFRGAPKSCFSDFSSFGTPRKRVFRNFEASGLPDGSFSQKTTRRGIPKHYFSEFLPFGMPRSTIFPVFSFIARKRNAVFGNFRRKNTSDGLFFAFFARRLQAKCCFR